MNSKILGQGPTGGALAGLAAPVMLAIGMVAAPVARADTPPAPPPAAPAASAPAAPAEETPWYPRAGVAEGGAIGFWRITSADAGRVGSLRLDIRGSYFQLNNFPTKGTDRLLTGEFSAGYTFFKGMEVFAAYQNSSNSNTYTIPRVVQAEGDLLAGLKAGGAVGPVKLAGDFRFGLKNGFGDDYFTVKSSDIQLRALMTYGVGHFQMDAQFGGIIGRDSDALSPYVNGEEAGLLYGSGVSGYHQIIAGLLLRYDLPIASPMLGFDFNVPLGISGTDLRAAGANLGDATAKRLALGARFHLGVGGAIDFALVGGLGKEVRGWAATEPWLITAAYSFGFDPAMYKAPQPPPPPPPPPARPITIHGSVVDAATGAPVSDAVIVPESSLPVATGPDGTFTTRDLKPGMTQLHVEREGFKPTDLQADAEENGAPVTIKLEAVAPPAPPPPVAQVVPAAPPTGYITGLLLGPAGGLQADVKITGTSSEELETAPNGTFSARLPAGPYDVVVMADGYFARAASVVVGTDQAQTIVLHTRPMPKHRTATLEGDKIKLAKPIVLNERRATPAAREVQELSEVADILVRHPEQRLVVAVHSDLPRGQTGQRVAWTQARADAIRDALIAQGAPADRVEARGMGDTEPIVPLGSRQASKNRRVELSLAPLPPKRVLSITPVAPAPAPASPPPAGGDLQELPPP